MDRSRVVLVGSLLLLLGAVGLTRAEATYSCRELCALAYTECARFCPVGPSTCLTNCANQEADCEKACPPA
jgi:multisubunit Na+/H+ antiporter MnhG subunit